MKRKLVIITILMLIALSITTVEAQNPSVQIYDNLTDDAIISGTVSIHASAYHPEGIIKINLATIQTGHISDTYQTTYPEVLDYDWDTTLFDDGTYTIEIRAYSNVYGNPSIQDVNWVTYSVTIDNIPDTTTEPSTTTTTTTDITTTSSPTEPDTGEPLGLSFDPILIGIVGGIGLISAVLVKRSMGGAKKVASDAKVLIICPYCGSKTEQGITKCQKCGADL